MSCGWSGNHVAVGKEEPEREEEPEAEATVLPAREAISLISRAPEGTEDEDEDGDSDDRRD